MKIYQGQPGTSDGILATLANRCTSFSLVAANITGSAATLTLNLVYGGGAAANGNKIVPAVSIPANSFVIVDFPLELSATDVIRGLQGTSSAITVTIDGTDASRLQE